MTGETARGWLYDGASAVRQDVALATASGGLALIFADGRSEGLARDTLLFGAEYRDSLLYRRTDRNGWQLTVERPLPPLIEALLPKGGDYGRWIDRIGLVPALAAGLAVSALVLLAAYFLPHLAAPLVPRSWERQYGDALVGDFGGKFCAGPGGQEALDALAAKIAPGNRDFDIRVVDIPMVNAAALPGGHIVIFRELLTEAEGPDEVAGVLGHEIAHVEHRDVTEAMIRGMGFGLIIGSFGGTTGGNVDAMLSMRYSRGAEHRADIGAIAALNRARIDPRATSAFFARLAEQEMALGRLGDTLSYISTHPMSAGRRDLFASSARRDAAYAPALDEKQWSALVGICRGRAAPRLVTKQG